MYVLKELKLQGIKWLHKLVIIKEPAAQWKDKAERDLAQGKSPKDRGIHSALSLKIKDFPKCFWMKANPESRQFSEISGPTESLLTYVL